MHSIKTLTRAAVLSLAALATPALAEEAFVRAPTAMRAGPDIDYPAINALRPGDVAFLHGCIIDYLWCDVTARRTRGWVLGDNLEIIEGPRRVLLPLYGPRLGLPIVTFSLGNYWDRHYRDRPWFRDRDRFARNPDWQERRRFDRGDGFDEVERPREFRERAQPSIQRPQQLPRVPEFKQQPGIAAGGPPAGGPPPVWRGKVAPEPSASPPPQRGGGQGGGGGGPACPPGGGKCF